MSNKEWVDELLNVVYPEDKLLPYGTSVGYIVIPGRTLEEQEKINSIGYVDVASMGTPQGLRYDDGKPPMHLLPPELMVEVAKVLQFGAKKYSPRNWELGMDWSRVYSSLSRHLLAWWGGEDNDPETGLSHLSHIGCNIAFLIAYNNRGIGTDDRPNFKRD